MWLLTLLRYVVPRRHWGTRAPAVAGSSLQQVWKYGRQHPRGPLRPLPDDVREHHAPPHDGRVRRAPPLGRLPHLHLSLGGACLLPHVSLDMGQGLSSPAWGSRLRGGDRDPHHSRHRKPGRGRLHRAPQGFLRLPRGIPPPQPPLGGDRSCAALDGMVWLQRGLRAQRWLPGRLLGRVNARRRLYFRHCLAVPLHASPQTSRHRHPQRCACWTRWDHARLGVREHAGYHCNRAVVRVSVLLWVPVFQRSNAHR
mmetsp:Transcript_33187/g.80402  ORF Transcript_33187/g.80402 Transcript_33187/m.80402 type:complete len:254 (-) Transcript_33187:644-1405(-)